MMWTEQQKNAIEARKGTVLVSAAAGSGKTAVLVERVFQRITDIENPCNIDELLIVTFTKPAAAQMREKIGKKLAEKIKEYPNDFNLQKQQMLLPYAKICTIDSFCVDLVRENFSDANVSHDFRLLNDNENKNLLKQVLDSVLEDLYKSENPDFINLTEALISQNNSDTNLADYVLKLYEIAQSYPFPEKYLDTIIELYSDGDIYKQEILNYICEALNYCISDCEKALKTAENNVDIFAKYSTLLSDEKNMFTKALKYAESGNWVNTMQAINNISFTRAPAIKGESFEKEAIKTVRDEYKDIIKKDLLKYSTADEEKFNLEIEITAPVVTELINVVKQFSRELSDEKHNRNTFYFSDIQHKAIDLLTDGINKTPLALELSTSFKEIMLDEYQDTNRAQDMLFSAISKDETNLFTVGDVKQSIYRFRQAMPEIFLERRNGMEKYTGDNYPAKIFLDKNFRSRKGIIEQVNFIFSQIMSERVGEVNYNDDEKLVYGADYPDTDEAECEICILNSEELLSEEAMVNESLYIAKRIKNIVGKLDVFDDGKLRKAEYSDICIMMRNLSDKGKILEKTLADCGIPASSDVTENLFEAHEVQVFLSLLKIIDNPVQDVPLVSVLLSPIFAFTPDDMANLRIKDRDASIYSCILQSDDERFDDFLQRLKYYRELSVTLSAESFLRRLLDDSFYSVMLLSMENGKEKLKNVTALLSYAKEYDSNYSSGFGGFVRFLEKIAENPGSASNRSVSGRKNTVKIMTIHKSKGLEFPVCFLADCSHKFNITDETGRVVIHPDLGIGCCYIDTENMVMYDTTAKNAVSLAIKKANISEEMRLLYVAMTRAKEKLICTMSLKNPAKTVMSLSQKISDDYKIPEFAVSKCKSYSDWLIMASLRHIDSNNLCIASGVNMRKLDTNFRQIVSLVNADNDVEEDNGEEIIIPDVDTGLLSEIKEAMEYEYPYLKLTDVLAKTTASALSQKHNYMDYFASCVPTFLNDGKLSPAQRGTALHKFMEYADFKKASENPSLCVEEILSMGVLTPQELEAVNFKSVTAFFESALGKRILKSNEVFREKEFIVELPVQDIYPELSEKYTDEKILVQGVVDCAFSENDGLVLIDFKTDKISDLSELKDRYSEQLRIYKKALEITVGKPVKETYLYSFKLNKEILL